MTVIFDMTAGPYRYLSMQDKRTEMRLLGISDAATEQELAAALQRRLLLEPQWWCYVPGMVSA